MGVVSTDGVEVAIHDKVKAEILEFLYERPRHGADWPSLRRLVEAKHGRQDRGYLRIMLLNIVGELRREGKTTGLFDLWVQLTTAQWLAITRSKQQS